jgi:cytochrome P450
MQALDEIPRTLGMWVITRHRDAQAVLADRTFSSALIPQLVHRQADRLSQSNVDRIERLGEKSLVFTDNPDHARLRGMVNRVFSPNAIAALRPRIAGAAEHLMTRAENQGGLDIIADYAAPLPITVMCDWMDLPESVRTQVGSWTHEVRYLLEPGLMSAAIFSRVCDVVESFTAALDDVLRHRRAHPGEDLISCLIATETGGGDALTDEEIVFLCIMSFVAGNETTKSLIGNGVLALLNHPEQASQLHRDPSLAEAAVSEALRYDSPLQMTKRLATRDVELAGQHVKTGDQVLLCLGAANRDPAVFDRPDQFELDRTGARHLGFGYGMHGCLGGLLATAQAEIAFGALYRRTVRLEIGTEGLEWQQDSFIVRGLTRLPVRLGTVPA